MKMRYIIFSSIFLFIKVFFILNSQYFEHKITLEFPNHERIRQKEECIYFFMCKNNYMFFEENKKLSRIEIRSTGDTSYFWYGGEIFAELSDIILFRETQYAVHFYIPNNFVGFYIYDINKNKKVIKYFRLIQKINGEDFVFDFYYVAPRELEKLIADIEYLYLGDGR